MRKWWTTGLLLLGMVAQCQQWQLLDSSQSGVSFRGLSVVNSQTAWVSGSKGTIGKTLDGGNSWTWLHPKGMQQRDFRDIEAFSDKIAVAMAIDSPGIIIKTTDGGQSWKTVYRSDVSGIFLDAMDFFGPIGYCVGDPIEGKFWLLQTINGGNSWQLLTDNNRPQALPGEACFAASGTNLLVAPDTSNGPVVVFVSGGQKSRLHMLSAFGKTALPLPLQSGSTSTGANSIAYSNNGMLVAGGDFSHPTRSDSSFTVISFSNPAPKPAAAPAYTSCIAITPQQHMLASGMGGVWFAAYAHTEKGNAWQAWKSLCTATMHVLRTAPDASVAFSAGSQGKIGKIVW